MKNILIVDDNKLNLMAAKMTLDPLYKVTAVSMGAQALQYLESNSCDLVLLDIDMPDMDGFEVLEKMKEMNLQQLPPVIFLTANTDPETITRCMDEGGMEIIDKPFVKKVLLTRIANLLELTDYRTGVHE